MTATIIYKGNLRCQATHTQSGSIIETDAPTDNKGKGERFSPTDLLCISLATCIVTTMGIKAMDMGVDLTNTNIEVMKYMITEPRSIGKIEINIQFDKSLKLEEKQQLILQRSGDNCPVKKSLHPNVEVITTLHW